MNDAMRPSVKPVVLCHINGDDDILRAWLDYYLRIGAGSFCFVVHGPPSENAVLYQALHSYPISVDHAYEGEFLSEEKGRRINRALERLRNRWVLLVDSDEFVELPYDLSTTIGLLDRMGANALYAPLLQRLRMDGSLESAAVVANPFQAFPSCSVDMHRQMGVDAAIRKFPLFFCNESTKPDPGYHAFPNGSQTVLSPLVGVVHHFKWRKTVIARLQKRAASNHTWRHESTAYLNYLRGNEYRLPTAGSFTYSRPELFRRGLLRRFPLSTEMAAPLYAFYSRLPGEVRGRIRRFLAW